MVFREMFLKDCSFHVLKEAPLGEVEGALLVCEENVDEEIFHWSNQVDLVKELAKENQYSG